MVTGSFRAADADRERIVALLVRHCGAGRLSIAELEALVDEAYGARTFDELDRCLRDLPPLPPATPVVAPIEPPVGSRLSRFLRRPTPRWLAAAAVAVAFIVGRQTDQPDVWVEPGQSASAEEMAADTPPLPPAGTQPDDAIAAELLVHQTYVQAFSGTSTNETKAAAVEESDSLEAASIQVRNRWPEEVRTSTVTVHRLVFTAPTEAFVEYEIRYGAGQTLGHRRGRAVLVDGRWQVDRETVCEVLEVAGASC